MTAATYNIVAEQGSTWNPPPWTHKDSTGAPVNLTGYTARMTVRDGYGSESAVLELTTENGGITLGGAAGTSGYGNHGTLVGAPQRVQVFRPDRLP